VRKQALSLILVLVSASSLNGITFVRNRASVCISYDAHDPFPGPVDRSTQDQEPVDPAPTDSTEREEELSDPQTLFVTVQWRSRSEIIEIESIHMRSTFKHEHTAKTHSSPNCTGGEYTEFDEETERLGTLLNPLRVGHQLMIPNVKRYWLCNTGASYRCLSTGGVVGAPVSLGHTDCQTVQCPWDYD